MNKQRLPLRVIRTNRMRSLLQILLLVLFTPLLAAPGFGQVTNHDKEQSENSTASDDSQEQVQRKTIVVLNLDHLQFDYRVEDPERKNQKQFTVVPRTLSLEATKGSSNAITQTGPDLSNFAFFLSAGATFPHGDLSTFTDPGFSVNGGLEYMFTQQFSAEGTLGYHRFSTFFGDSLALYQISGNGKFYFVDESSRLRPFINGGVGAYVTDSGSANFGGNVGGGVLYEVTPQFGVLGSYNFHAFTGGSGLQFSTVQGGVRFRF